VGGLREAGIESGHWVFGYGSLVQDGGRHDRRALLPGHRRVWGVATDNLRAIPGYKMYLRRSDGIRPAVYVAFLDLERAPKGEVNGTVRRVSTMELELLDKRERNYDRIDVSGLLEGVEDPVWTYVGSAAGRERLRRGRSEGRAVISRDYLQRVHAGFRALGEEEHRRFVASSELDGLPVWDLERIDLPADAPPAEEGA
jgi:hypothetical protein